MRLEWQGKAYKVSVDTLKPFVEVVLKGMAIKLGLVVLFSLLSIVNMILFFVFDETIWIAINWAAYALNVFSVRSYYKGYIYGGKVLSFLMQIFGEQKVQDTIDEITYDQKRR